MAKSASSELLQIYTKEKPVNLRKLAGALGLRVNADAKLPEGISGHLKRLENNNYEIAANTTEHEYRQRFTLAHEIGHFVLHLRDVEKFGGVDDDVKYRSTEIGDFYNTEIDELHERQANSFAANILMPEKLVRAEIASIQEKENRNPTLQELYRAFEVSPSAMRWRIKNLKLLDQVDETQ